MVISISQKIRKNLINKGLTSNTYEINYSGNCSTDGTKELLETLNDDSIRIIHQLQNYGYGMSVITAVNLAKGEYLFVHNSDLEYDPSCVYDMLSLADKDNLDVVFGSRLYNRTHESKLKILKERPFYLGSMITTGLTNIFYGRKFTDIIGTRFYRVSALKKINPQLHKIGFDFEVVSKLCKYGCKIEEVPVKYSPRTVGKKVKPYDIIPAVLTMFKVKFFDRGR